MNRTEYSITKKYTPHTPTEASREQMDMVVAGIIRMRMKRAVDIAQESGAYAKNKHRQEPILPPPPGADILFQSKELWLPVDGYYFIPDTLVKACFIHKSGIQQSQRNTSVFWAMRKDVVQKRWGISPLCATQKQRNQFWDFNFVSAIITSIQQDGVSHSKLHNKISYQLTSDVTVEHLSALRDSVYAQCSSLAVHSQSTAYEQFRRTHLGV